MSPFPLFPRNLKSNIPRGVVQELRQVPPRVQKYGSPREKYPHQFGWAQGGSCRRFSRVMFPPVTRGTSSPASPSVFFVFPFILLVIGRHLQAESLAAIAQACQEDGCSVEAVNELLDQLKFKKNELEVLRVNLRTYYSVLVL